MDSQNEKTITKLVKKTDRRRKSDASDYLFESEIENIKQAFLDFDVNGDGKIDATELHQAMNNYGFTLTEKAVFKLMEAFDTNGDGDIDFDEFLKMVSPDFGDYIQDVRVALGAFKHEESPQKTNLIELEKILLDITEEHDSDIKTMIQDQG